MPATTTHTPTITTARSTDPGERRSVGVAMWILGGRTSGS
jgi:hypothetical protein